jgi:hypothetical protein
MAVVPLFPSAFVPNPASSATDFEADEGDVAAVKCGHCRSTFMHHPSELPSDSPRWSLCPWCRDRLLDDSATADRDH